MFASISKLIVFTMLVCIGSSFAWADPTFPQLTGRIIDTAQLLSAEDKTQIEADLKALEEKSSDQVVVYTTDSLQGYDISDYGYRLGRAWAIGQKGGNNGVILIVAPKDRKVRIEVGRGLEPILTDLMTKLIIENAILPAFRRGSFPDGIKAGIRDIRDTLLGDAEGVKQRAVYRKTQTREASANEKLLTLAVMVFIFLIVFGLQYRQARSGMGDRSRRYGSSATPIFIPGGWGGSGNWGGRGSDGDGNGGGWSGGGGDFGGGGASGDW